MSDLAERLRKIPGFVDVTSSTRAEEDNHIERLDNRDAAFLTANLGGDYSLGEATRQVVAISGRDFPARHLPAAQGGFSEKVTTVFTSFAMTLGLSSRSASLRCCSCFSGIGWTRW